MRSHLASVGVFHDKTESIVGLEGIFQCLKEENNHISGNSPESVARSSSYEGNKGTALNFFHVVVGHYWENW